MEIIDWHCALPDEMQWEVVHSITSVIFLPKNVQPESNYEEKETNLDCGTLLGNWLGLFKNINGMKDKEKKMHECSALKRD